MPSIEIQKRAEQELISASRWYEEQQYGLSKRFRAEVKAILTSICLNPDFYPQKFNNELYFAPVKKFPYLIVYWFDEKLDTVYIISIFHTKRNPDKFKSY